MTINCRARHIMEDGEMSDERSRKTNEGFEHRKNLPEEPRKTAREEMVVGDKEGGWRC